MANFVLVHGAWIEWMVLALAGAEELRKDRTRSLHADLVTGLGEAASI